jgi:lysophospholipase L1-like esterase
MLCADRFHPGAEGYRLWAERIANMCSDVLDTQLSRFHPSQTTLTD